MFSQTVEYALRAAVYLAAQPGVPATTEDVASGRVCRRRTWQRSCKR